MIEKMSPEMSKLLEEVMVLRAVNKEMVEALRMIATNDYSSLHLNNMAEEALKKAEGEL